MTIRTFFAQLVHGPLGARRGATNQALGEIMARQASRLPLTRAEEKRISDHWDRCTEQTIRDVARYEEWIAQHG